MIDSYVVQPEWLVPLTTEPIELGYLCILSGRVEYVGKELPLKYRALPFVRLQNTAVLPGLVNAHCHLEFSDLENPIPAVGPFPNWIRTVVERRRSEATNSELQGELRRASIQKGIAESYACGVRWIVDMATEPWNDEWIADSPIHLWRCIEMMDVSSVRDSQTRSFLARSLIAEKAHDSHLPRLGLSPHSPYTASQRLTEEMCELSRTDLRLISMHVAESLDEVFWMSNQRPAEFEKLLTPLISADYHQRFVSASHHVQCLALIGWRALLVHGNYLSPTDLAIVSGARHRTAIVHCPRTFAHFAHRIEGQHYYPLELRLQIGARHLLGTDSRASNPDLNLWRDLQHVRKSNTGLSNECILKMATVDAAEFLDLGNRFGAIQKGYTAELTAVQLTQQASGPSELMNMLLKSDTRSLPIEALIAF